MGADIYFPMNMALAHQEAAKVEARKLAALKSALERIVELHDQYDGPHTYCHGCASKTPCPTITIANAALKVEETR